MSGIHELGQTLCPLACGVQGCVVRTVGEGRDKDEQ